MRSANALLITLGVGIIVFGMMLTDEVFNAVDLNNGYYCWPAYFGCSGYWQAWETAFVVILVGLSFILAGAFLKKTPDL